MGRLCLPTALPRALAAGTELSSGVKPGAASTELLRYGQGVSTRPDRARRSGCRAVVQRPGRPARSAIGLTLASVLVATFITGPGAVALTNGYPNFVFAAATACLVLLLAATVTDFSVVRLLAICGLVVATTIPGAAVRRSPRRVPATCSLHPATGAAGPGGGRGVIVIAVVLAVVVVSCLVVLPVLSASGASGAMTVGGPPEFSINQLLLASGAALITALLPLQAGFHGWRRLRVTAAALPTLVGLVMLAVLAAYQTSTSGQLADDFGKLWPWASRSWRSPRSCWR